MRPNSIKTILMAASVALASTAVAQTTTLTLDDAVRIALSDNPTVKVGVSRNLVGINFRHPNVMPNFAVWKTITYRHWHRWCCQPRF